MAAHVRKLRQFTQAHIFDNRSQELTPWPRNDKSPTRNDCGPGLISGNYCTYKSSESGSNSTYNSTRSHAHLRSSLYLPSCCTNSTPEISCGSRSGMIRLTEAV